MQIQSYRFGHITVDAQAYARDLLLLPPRVFSPWWRREGHNVELADLALVLAFDPEVLVIGTGDPGLMKVPEQTHAALAGRGVEVEVMPTRAAWRRFNELEQGGRRVAAAFHLTC